MNSVAFRIWQSIVNSINESKEVIAELMGVKLLVKYKKFCIDFFAFYDICLYFDIPGTVYIRPGTV